MQCFTSIHNVFYNDHIPSDQVLVQANGGYYITALFHSLVRSQFDKTDLRINGQVLKEI